MSSLMCECHLLIVPFSCLMERKGQTFGVFCVCASPYRVTQMDVLTWDRHLQLHYVKTRGQYLSIRTTFSPQTTGSPTLFNPLCRTAAFPQAAPQGKGRPAAGTGSFRGLPSQPESVLLPLCATGLGNNQQNQPHHYWPVAPSDLCNWRLISWRQSSSTTSPLGMTASSFCGFFSLK